MFVCLFSSFSAGKLILTCCSAPCFSLSSPPESALGGHLWRAPPLAWPAERSRMLWYRLGRLVPGPGHSGCFQPFAVTDTTDYYSEQPCVYVICIFAIVPLGQIPKSRDCWDKGKFVFSLHTAKYLSLELGEQQVREPFFPEPCSETRLSDFCFFFASLPGGKCCLCSFHWLSRIRSQ